jgi:hypothetical protein
MDDSLTVEPFGFFSLDSLRAGWYLLWRQMVRVVPLAVAAILIGGLLGTLGLGVVGAVVAGLGICVAAIWAAVLLPRLASRWALATHGYPLTGEVRVWWGIVWRVSLASLIAAFVLAPPNLVALSVSTSFPASALGQLGKLLTALLGVANFAVSILATGWAMSRLTAQQLSGLPVGSLGLAPIVREPTRSVVDERLAVGAFAPVVAPVAVPAAAGSTSTGLSVAPAAVRVPAGATGKRQCPKCGLHETERGSVVGWYCTVCGWRESRR